MFTHFTHPEPFKPYNGNPPKGRTAACSFAQTGTDLEQDIAGIKEQLEDLVVVPASSHLEEQPLDVVVHCDGQEDEKWKKRQDDECCRTTNNDKRGSIGSSPGSREKKMDRLRNTSQERQIRSSSSEVRY